MKGKKLKLWQMLVLIFSTVTVATGGTLLYIYLSGGFDEKFIEPENVLFVDNYNNYDVDKGQIEIDSDFKLLVKSDTKGVTETKVTLSFDKSLSIQNISYSEFVDVDGTKYISNGIIRVPETVELGKEFTINVEQKTYSYNEGTYQANVGGITTLMAKGEKEMGEIFDKINIAVDVPVEYVDIDLQDTFTQETKPVEDEKVVVLQNTNFVVKPTFYPAHSEFRFSDELYNEFYGTELAPRKKSYCLDCSDKNVQMNYTDEGITFSSNYIISSGNEINFYIFKKAVDEEAFLDKFNEENPDATQRVLYTTMLNTLSNPELNKGTIKEHIDVSVEQAKVHSFRINQKEFSMYINQRYRLFANNNAYEKDSLKLAISDEKGEDLKALIREVALQVYCTIDGVKTEVVDSSIIKILGGREKVVFELTTDTLIDNNKIYYEINDDDEYVVVETPAEEKLGNYYEKHVYYFVNSNVSNPNFAYWDISTTGETYKLTSDSDIVSDKIYYEKNVNGFVVVDTPIKDKISSYYEKYVANKFSIEANVVLFITEKSEVDPTKYEEKLFNIENQAERVLNIEVEEHIEDNVSWAGEKQINKTIIHSNGSIIPAEVELLSKVNIPPMNVYQTPYFYVYKEGISKDDVNIDDTFIVFEGNNYCKVSANDIMFKSAGLYSVIFVTVRTDAYGKVLFKDGKAQIIKTSDVLKINVAETLQEFTTEISIDDVYGVKADEEILYYAVDTLEGLISLKVTVSEETTEKFVEAVNNGNGAIIDKTKDSLIFYVTSADGENTYRVTPEITSTSGQECILKLKMPNETFEDNTGKGKAFYVQIVHNNTLVDDIIEVEVQDKYISAGPEDRKRNCFMLYTPTPEEIINEVLFGETFNIDVSMDATGQYTQNNISYKADINGDGVDETIKPTQDQFFKLYTENVKVNDAYGREYKGIRTISTQDATSSVYIADGRIGFASTKDDKYEDVTIIVSAGLKANGEECKGEFYLSVKSYGLAKVSVAGVGYTGSNIQNIKHEIVGSAGTTVAFGEIISAEVGKIDSPNTLTSKFYYIKGGQDVDLLKMLKEEKETNTLDVSNIEYILTSLTVGNDISKEVYYEYVSGAYVKTSDTTVVEGKNYYEAGVKDISGFYIAHDFYAGADFTIILTNSKIKAERTIEVPITFVIKPYLTVTENLTEVKYAEYDSSISDENTLEDGLYAGYSYSLNTIAMLSNGGWAYTSDILDENGVAVGTISGSTLTFDDVSEVKNYKVSISNNEGNKYSYTKTLDFKVYPNIKISKNNDINLLKLKSGVVDYETYLNVERLRKAESTPFENNYKFKPLNESGEIDNTFNIQIDDDNYFSLQSAFNFGYNKYDGYFNVGAYLNGEPALDANGNHITTSLRYAVDFILENDAVENIFTIGGGVKPAEVKLIEFNGIKALTVLSTNYTSYTLDTNIQTYDKTSYCYTIQRAGSVYSQTENTIRFVAGATSYRFGENVYLNARIYRNEPKSEEAIATVLIPLFVSNVGLHFANYSDYNIDLRNDFNLNTLLYGDKNGYPFATANAGENLRLTYKQSGVTVQDRYQGLYMKYVGTITEDKFEENTYYINEPNYTLAKEWTDKTEYYVKTLDGKSMEYVGIIAEKEFKADTYYVYFNYTLAEGWTDKTEYYVKAPEGIYYDQESIVEVRFENGSLTSEYGTIYTVDDETYIQFNNFANQTKKIVLRVKLQFSSYTFEYTYRIEIQPNIYSEVTYPFAESANGAEFVDVSGDDEYDLNEAFGSYAGEKQNDKRFNLFVIGADNKTVKLTQDTYYVAKDQVENNKVIKAGATLYQSETLEDGITLKYALHVESAELVTIGEGEYYKVKITSSKYSVSSISIRSNTAEDAQDMVFDDLSTDKDYIQTVMSGVEYKIAARTQDGYRIFTLYDNEKSIGIIKLTENGVLTLISIDDEYFIGLNIKKSYNNISNADLIYKFYINNTSGTYYVEYTSGTWTTAREVKTEIETDFEVSKDESGNPIKEEITGNPIMNIDMVVKYSGGDITARDITENDGIAFAGTVNYIVKDRRGAIVEDKTKAVSSVKLEKVSVSKYTLTIVKPEIIDQNYQLIIFFTSDQQQISQLTINIACSMTLEKIESGKLYGGEYFEHPEFAEVYSIKINGTPTGITKVEILNLEDLNFIESDPVSGMNNYWIAELIEDKEAKLDVEITTTSGAIYSIDKVSVTFSASFMPTTEIEVKEGYVAAQVEIVDLDDLYELVGSYSDIKYGSFSIEEKNITGINTNYFDQNNIFIDGDILNIKSNNVAEKVNAQFSLKFKYTFTKGHSFTWVTNFNLTIEPNARISTNYPMPENDEKALTAESVKEGLYKNFFSTKAYLGKEDTTRIYIEKTTNGTDFVPATDVENNVEIRIKSIKNTIVSLCDDAGNVIKENDKDMTVNSQTYTRLKATSLSSNFNFELEPSYEYGTVVFEIVYNAVKMDYVVNVFKKSILVEDVVKTVNNQNGSEVIFFEQLNNGKIFSEDAVAKVDMDPDVPSGTYYIKVQSKNAGSPVFVGFEYDSQITKTVYVFLGEPVLLENDNSGNSYIIGIFASKASSAKDLREVNDTKISLTKFISLYYKTLDSNNQVQKIALKGDIERTTDTSDYMPTIFLVDDVYYEKVITNGEASYNKIGTTAEFELTPYVFGSYKTYDKTITYKEEGKAQETIYVSTFNDEKVSFRTEVVKSISSNYFKGEDAKGVFYVDYNTVDLVDTVGGDSQYFEIVEPTVETLDVVETIGERYQVLKEHITSTNSNEYFQVTKNGEAPYDDWVYTHYGRYDQAVYECTYTVAQFTGLQVATDFAGLPGRIEKEEDEDNVYKFKANVSYYTATSDTVANTEKTYYQAVKVEVDGSENPKDNGYYEINSLLFSIYIRTSDTTVQTGKEYFTLETVNTESGEDISGKNYIEKIEVNVDQYIVATEEKASYTLKASDKLTTEKPIIRANTKETVTGKIRTLGGYLGSDRYVVSEPNYVYKVLKISFAINKTSTSIEADQEYNRMTTFNHIDIRAIVGTDGLDYIEKEGRYYKVQINGIKQYYLNGGESKSYTIYRPEMIKLTESVEPKEEYYHLKQEFHYWTGETGEGKYSFASVTSDLGKQIIASGYSGSYYYRVTTHDNLNSSDPYPHVIMIDRYIKDYTGSTKYVRYVAPGGVSTNSVIPVGTKIYTSSNGNNFTMPFGYGYTSATQTDQGRFTAIKLPHSKNSSANPFYFNIPNEWFAAGDRFYEGAPSPLKSPTIDGQKFYGFTQKGNTYYVRADDVKTAKIKEEASGVVRDTIYYQGQTLDKLNILDNDVEVGDERTINLVYGFGDTIVPVSFTYRMEINLEIRNSISSTNPMENVTNAETQINVDGYDAFNYIELEVNKEYFFNETVGVTLPSSGALISTEDIYNNTVIDIEVLSAAEAKEVDEIKIMTDENNKKINEADVKGNDNGLIRFSYELVKTNSSSSGIVYDFKIKPLGADNNGDFVVVKYTFGKKLEDGTTSVQYENYVLFKIVSDYQVEMSDVNENPVVTTQEEGLISNKDNVIEITDFDKIGYLKPKGESITKDTEIELVYGYKKATQSSQGTDVYTKIKYNTKYYYVLSADISSTAEKEGKAENETALYTNIPIVVTTKENVNSFAVVRAKNAHDSLRNISTLAFTAKMTGDLIDTYFNTEFAGFDTNYTVTKNNNGIMLGFKSEVGLGERNYTVTLTDDYGYKIEIYFKLLAPSNPIVSNESATRFREGETFDVASKFNQISITEYSFKYNFYYDLGKTTKETWSFGLYNGDFDKNEIYYLKQTKNDCADLMIEKSASQLLSEVANPTGDPKANGWYTLIDDKYIKATDTVVVTDVTYYQTTEDEIYTLGSKNAGTYAFVDKDVRKVFDAGQSDFNLTYGYGYIQDPKPEGSTAVKGNQTRINLSNGKFADFNNDWLIPNAEMISATLKTPDKNEHTDDTKRPSKLVIIEGINAFGYTEDDVSVQNPNSQYFKNGSDLDKITIESIEYYYQDEKIGESVAASISIPWDSDGDGTIETGETISEKTLASTTKLYKYNSKGSIGRSAQNIYTTPVLPGWVYGPNDQAEVEMRINFKYNGTEEYVLSFPIIVDKETPRVLTKNITDISDNVEFDLVHHIIEDTTEKKYVYYDDTLAVTLPPFGGLTVNVSVDGGYQIANLGSGDNPQQKGLYEYDSGYKLTTDTTVQSSKTYYEYYIFEDSKTFKGSKTIASNSSNMDTTYYLGLSEIVGHTINPSYHIEVTFSNYDKGRVTRSGNFGFYCEYAGSEIASGNDYDFEIPYIPVQNPTGSPIENCWYELNYIPTDDVEIVEGKKYYWCRPAAIPDMDPSYSEVNEEDLNGSPKNNYWFEKKFELTTDEEVVSGTTYYTGFIAQNDKLTNFGTDENPKYIPTEFIGSGGALLRETNYVLNTSKTETKTVELGLTKITTDKLHIADMGNLNGQEKMLVTKYYVGCYDTNGTTAGGEKEYYQIVKKYNLYPNTFAYKTDDYRNHVHAELTHDCGGVDNCQCDTFELSSWTDEITVSQVKDAVISTSRLNAADNTQTLYFELGDKDTTYASIDRSSGLITIQKDKYKLDGTNYITVNIYVKASGEEGLFIDDNLPYSGNEFNKPVITVYVYLNDNI